MASIYNYLHYVPEVNSNNIYDKELMKEHDEYVEYLRNTQDNFEYFDSIKNELTLDSVQKILSSVINSKYSDRIPDLYKSKISEIEHEFYRLRDEHLAKRDLDNTDEFKISRETTIEDQNEINKLQEQIKNYDIQINNMLEFIKPYMQIPKVNREISKVIEKNNEINSLQIVDTLSDYRKVLEMKENLVKYLNQATMVIKNGIEKETKQEIPSNHDLYAEYDNSQKQAETQQLSNEFWSEFEKPGQEQKNQQSVPENFWNEFDKPNNISRPERMYNSDGTYTLEYITYVANTPLGFNQTIYDQLMEENELKRKQNEGQITSDGKSK